MTGGILQLVTIGVESLYLTGNPQITMFKMVYRRHTNFSINDDITKIKSITHFGDSARHKLERIGDCIHKLYLVFDVPDIVLKFEDPTILRIASLLTKYGIHWNYVGDGFTATNKITEAIYTNNVKPLIYDRIKELVELYDLYVEHLKDVDDGYADTLVKQSDTKNGLQNFIYDLENLRSIIATKNELILSALDTENSAEDDLYTCVTNIKHNLENSDEDDIKTYASNIKTILTATTVDVFPTNIHLRIDTVYAMLLAISTDISDLSHDSETIASNTTTYTTLFVKLDTSITFIYTALKTANNLLNTNQQRYLALNYEFIEDITPNVIDNLPSSIALIKTKLLHSGLLAYKKDIIAFDPDMNTKVYNASEIKNAMYNQYLNYVVKSFASSPDAYTYTTSGITNIFDPSASPGDANYTQIYDNVIFYHVLEFGKYNVLPNLIGVPTQQYFDKIISDGFQNSSGKITYISLDGYKIYSKYIVALSQTFRLLDSTSNLILVQQNMLENILWNMRRNYQQLINILNFLSFGNFSDTKHYRLGYYKRYNQFGTSIVGTNSVFNSLSESKIPELDDNIFSVLKLAQLSGEPLTTISQFYTDEIVKQLRSVVVTIQDAIEVSAYEDYYNNYNLWKRLVVDNSPMKTILDNSTTALYNQSVNFYTSFSSFGDSGKKRMSVMNYIPLLAVRDIPTMMYNLLNETTLDLSNDSNTSSELTNLLKNYLDYRDMDQRNSDIPTAVDDFKKDLYSDVLEAVMFYNNSGTYTLIDETYLRTVAATYASTSSEYVTIPIFRPESVMTVGDFIDVLPIKAVVERFRIEFKSKAATFITANNITNGSIIYDMIDNIVNSFIKDSIPSHSTYVNNGYSFYKIDDAITSSNITEPRYCDSISSIWYKINKKMIRTYNDLINNYLLSRSYYADNLGPTMVENFTKFKKLVTASPYSVEYYNTDNPYSYPMVYSSTDQPVSNEGFNFYLLRPTDGEPYTTTKIDVTHMITHFEKDYIQYNTLKNILNIKNVTINRRLYQYNEVATITYNITQTMTPYADNTGNTLRANTIIANTKTTIDNSYKGVMDIIGGTYSAILEKSIKGIIQLGMTISDPYISSKNVTTNMSSVNRLSFISSWWTTKEPSYSTYFTGSPNLYNLLSDILNSVTAITLYTDRDVKTLYNNYATRLDVLNYVINKVVSSTNIGFIIDSLDTSTLATVKNSLRSFIIKNINANNNVINNIAVNHTTSPDDGYTYPLYSYDPNTPNDSETFNITYNNSNIDVLIKKYVNNEQPSFAWAKELGHRIIDTVKIEVDGIVYDEYTSELMHLDHQLRGDTNHDRGYNIMIGNTEDMYTISSNRRNTMRLYVPLNFWFCRDIGNSLPMINVLYSDIILHINTKPIEEILYRDSESHFVKKPKLGAHLITRYIYLDDDERQKIAKSKMEFLIEKYRYGGKHTYEFNDFSDNTLHSQLFCHDPCKYLIWTSKIKSKTASAKDKIDWMYSGYRTKDNAGRLTIKNQSIDKTKIQFNGRDRETYKTAGYYSTVQPHSKYTSSLDFGEYLYSFATLPLLLQPSGSANLTHIAELAIVDTYKDNTITSIKNNDLIIENEYWARTYQVVRIMSGIMAPAFIY